MQKTMQNMEGLSQQKIMELCANSNGIQVHCWSRLSAAPAVAGRRRVTRQPCQSHGVGGLSVALSAMLRAPPA
jgi:hypothetical protein